MAGHVAPGVEAHPLGPADFAAVNPNTGTAPIFRSPRDAAITTRIYRAHPVLVRHVFARERDPFTGEMIENPEKIVDELRAYPVRYCTMFHMTNDSGLFRTPGEASKAPIVGRSNEGKPGTRKGRFGRETRKGKCGR